MKEDAAMAGKATVNPRPSAASTFHPPQYTMKDIYAAIPPHCFHPNTLISLAYVLRDLLLVLTLALLASQIPQYISHPYLRAAAWAAYSFCQGLVFTGLWEIGHESGHGALSKHRWVNHAIGLPIHSALLTPYHSWRFTHQTHHKHTNHLEKDIAFVPDTHEQHLAAKAGNPFAALPFWELAEDTPAVALVTLFFHQLIAFPIYLTLNNFALERMRVVKWWKRSHFYFGGDGPNFRPWHGKEIVISDLGIAVVVAGLWMAGQRWGWGNVFCFYGWPYLWTNHWILMITFLHHTDFALPYYPPSSFTFLRGAASTIDRDFGFIGHHLFHGAVNTHVLHHHCCKIPFYYAQEASNAMRTVMGNAYISDFERNYLAAFWRNYTTCKFVEPTVTGPGCGTVISGQEKKDELYFFNGSGMVVATPLQLEVKRKSDQ